MPACRSSQATRDLPSCWATKGTIETRAPIVQSAADASDVDTGRGHGGHGGTTLVARLGPHRVAGLALPARGEQRPYRESTATARRTACSSPAECGASPLRLPSRLDDGHHAYVYMPAALGPSLVLGHEGDHRNARTYRSICC